MRTLHTVLASAFASIVALSVGGCSSGDPTVQDSTPTAGTDEAVTGALYNCLVAVETDLDTCAAVGSGGVGARRWGAYECVPFCPTPGCVSPDYYYYYLEVDRRLDGGGCYPQSQCRVQGSGCSQNSDCCTYNCQSNGHYMACH